MSLGLEQSFLSCCRYTNSAASLPLPEQQGMTGTGVFLPSNPGSEDGTANEQTCGESDGDSAESSADCLMLDEAAPIRRGVLLPEGRAT